jgi:hypothetical protein
MLLNFLTPLLALSSTKAHNHLCSLKRHGGLKMLRTISQLLAEDVAATVRAEYLNVGIVNVSALSEVIRLRHERENIALEDIAEMVMTQARILGAAMEFYRADTAAAVNQVNGQNGGSLARGDDSRFPYAN